MDGIGQLCGIATDQPAVLKTIEIIYGRDRIENELKIQHDKTRLTKIELNEYNKHSQECDGNSFMRTQTPSE